MDIANATEEELKALHEKFPHVLDGKILMRGFHLARKYKQMFLAVKSATLNSSRRSTMRDYNSEAIVYREASEAA